MWTAEAFYNKILHYSIFPCGFSPRNKGEMTRSYHKIKKTVAQEHKLICHRLCGTQD